MKHEDGFVFVLEDVEEDDLRPRRKKRTLKTKLHRKRPRRLLFIRKV